MSNQEPKPKVMIVDDHAASLNLLEEMLENKNYQVCAFLRGRLALAAAAKEPPDLILLDINMPEMDGYEVCQQLKADAKLKEIPVLFISARNETMDKVKAFGLGGVDYVAKPFQFDEVHARVRTHLELQRQKQELRENYVRLCELEKLRDNLAAMIVHDIRSPLAALIGYLEMLKIRTAAKLSTMELQYVNRAYENAEKIIDMATSLLDIGRLEDGKMPLHRQAYDLTALIVAANNSIGSLVGNRRVTFWSPQDPAMVVADKDIIQRVLANLLQNAIKFTSNDGRIDITASRKDERVHVAVTDNGPGIPPEYHVKIFEKFGQVDKQARRHSTGLGLTFCKLAVEAHNGQIGVESQVGGGSTFWFTLPAA